MVNRFLALVVLGLLSVAYAEDHSKRQQAGGSRGSSKSHNYTILYVHAATAALAWIVFFPVGSILLRYLKTNNAWWIHAIIQVFSSVLFTVGVATGIYIAKKYKKLDNYHTIIGLLVFALLFIQIAGGTIHHLLFRKYQKRTFISHLHIWLGRILITLGMINGGLGMLLAGLHDNSIIISYAVLVALIWVGCVVLAINGGRKKPATKDSETKDPRTRQSAEQKDLEY